MSAGWRLPAVALLIVAMAGAATARERWAGMSSADHFGAGPCPTVAFSLSVDGAAIEGSAESESGGGRVQWSISGFRTHTLVQIEMSRRPQFWKRKIRIQWTGFLRHGLMQLTSGLDESCRQPRSVNLRRID